MDSAFVGAGPVAGEAWAKAVASAERLRNKTVATISVDWIVRVMRFPPRARAGPVIKVFRNDGPYEPEVRGMGIPAPRGERDAFEPTDSCETGS